jgi:ribosomal-protein-alanine N-acetyltransferase
LRAGAGLQVSYSVVMDAQYRYENLEWRDCIPVITTERLVLRLSGAEDVDNIRDYYAREQAHFKPWFPDSALNLTREMIVRAVAEKQALASEDRGYKFHAFLRAEPRQVVGQCSVADVRRGAIQQAVIGYALAAEFQGKGLMTEAVRAAVKFAFADLDLHRLEGSYMPNNAKSGAILASCGFKQEGMFKDYLFLNGHWQDHIVTSLLNPDWRGIGRVVS